MRYEPVIGLEIHVELSTNSKMFCGCSASYFGDEPNSHCCPICLGLPGSLPVPNRKAVEWTVMLGLALNCTIPPLSKFDRKNYFYPDLPKGYQISQYDMPFCVNGWIETTAKSTPEVEKVEKSARDGRQIKIRRVHLEEDTGKLIHTTIDGQKWTLIDFNRSGVPLVEIVTEPSLHSTTEAKLFLEKLQQIIRYLDISDADMEKGSMRCEPNVSMSVPPSEESRLWRRATSEEGLLPDYKVEIKNINSFKFVEKAIEYEIKRQIRILNQGQKVTQETRGWDEKKGITISQRIKEEAHDYRYFPEPDIPPIKLSKAEIKKIKNLIPELPDEKLQRFIKEYGLSFYDALVLTVDRKIADWFEEATKAYTQTAYPKLKPKTKIKIEKSAYAKPVANWIMGELARWLRILKKKIDEIPLFPAFLAELLYLIDKGEISKITAKQVFEEMVRTGQTASKIIKKRGLKQILDKKKIEEIITKILLDNQQAVGDYKKGKKQALNFLIGQAQRETKGKVDFQILKNLILKLIK